MACLRNFSLKKLQQTKEEGETLLAGTAVFFSGVLQQQPGKWQQPLLQEPARFGPARRSQPELREEQAGRMGWRTGSDDR